jgi:hypothetical protein
VDVDKRLTIRSENGAASTTVNALSSNDHVFEVIADYYRDSRSKVLLVAERREYLSAVT